MPDTPEERKLRIFKRSRSRRGWLRLQGRQRIPRGESAGGGGGEVRDRDEAPELLQKILGCPFGRQLTLVRNSRRFQTRALGQLVLDACQQYWFNEPHRAVAVADLAIVIAEHLDPRRYPASLIADLSAQAFAYRANSWRILSQFQQAEEDFHRAQYFLDQGTGDVSLSALILDLKASLRMAQGHLDRANENLDRARAIYEGAGDQHLVGHILIKKATVLTVAGELEEAIALLQQTLELLSPQRDPRLLLAARHNLVACLIEAERFREAFSLFPPTRQISLRVGNRLDLVRLCWLEGKIASGLDRLQQAEGCFQMVRRAFIKEGMAVDAAEVSLDLAVLYAQQHRAADLKRLVQEMVPIFQSRDLEREALAALILLRQAVEMETLTLTMVQRIARYFKKACREPGLRSPG